MSPQSRMEDEPPYRWKGGLNDREVEGLSHAVPQGSSLNSQLEKAANEAAAMAMRLNEVDRGAAV